MNPSTKKIQTKLAVIRLLQENKRMSLEDLSKYSGIEDIKDLKKELGKLYMVGSYPYTPDQFIELDYDGDTIGIRMPVDLEQGLVLSVREWAAIRSLFLEEDEKEISPSRKKILQSILEKIHAILPSAGVPSENDLKKRIHDAIQSGKSLEMQYQANGEAQAEIRRVDPWALLSFREEYLIGYCHVRKAPRTFRLDSIIQLSLTDQDSVQVPDEERKEAILKLKKFLSQTEADSEVAEIYHTAEVYFNLHSRLPLERTKDKIQLKGVWYYLSKTKIRNEEWFLSTLKGFGPNVIIRSPENLQERMRLYWEAQSLLER
ncbi:WYL domain-containing protein [Leptospira langatensis]|uniref:WYL domain-containing protein n=1 Tax=Leptospira langatensis TaxID=2484983 RepID=A0A5F1ZXT7_9LEPT|nr:WYL domain-containing protein [Leptospira langatensis]TGK01606.1 WYL domain-containing protein [Leptospira langatensis]TGL42451.1 WYL domain-containing protein [Leptospira langatensis]